MTIETIPHIIETHYLTKEKLVEKSPNCPEDIDPYGDIPPEAEFLKPSINEYRQLFIERHADVGWSQFKPSPEGGVEICATEDGRGGKVLIVSVRHHQPTSCEDEVFRGEISRYFLHPNDVGTYQTLMHIFKEHDDEYGKPMWIHEYTVLDQGFMQEIHLESLRYARIILER